MVPLDWTSETSDDVTDDVAGDVTDVAGEVTDEVTDAADITDVVDVTDIADAADIADVSDIPDISDVSDEIEDMPGDIPDDMLEDVGDMPVEEDAGMPADTDGETTEELDGSEVSEVSEVSGISEASEVDDASEEITEEIAQEVADIPDMPVDGEYGMESVDESEQVDQDAEQTADIPDMPLDDGDDEGAEETEYISDGSALGDMTAYMYEHRAQTSLHADYKNDPEWQRLNEALIEENRNSDHPHRAPNLAVVDPEAVSDTSETADASDLLDESDVDESDVTESVADIPDMPLDEDADTDVSTALDETPAFEESSELEEPGGLEEDEDLEEAEVLEEPEGVDLPEAEAAESFEDSEVTEASEGFDMPQDLSESEAMDSAESMESADVAETVESTESTETMESTESADATELDESAEPLESAEFTDTDEGERDVDSGLETDQIAASQEFAETADTPDTPETDDIPESSDLSDASELNETPGMKERLTAEQIEQLYEQDPELATRTLTEYAARNLPEDDLESLPRSMRFDDGMDIQVIDNDLSWESVTIRDMDTGREFTVYPNMMSRVAHMDGQQGQNSLGLQQDCGIASTAKSINDFYGKKVIDENRLADFAYRTGNCALEYDKNGNIDFARSGGTIERNVQALYRANGIDAEAYTGNDVPSLDDLAERLKSGEVATLAVNSDLLWHYDQARRFDLHTDVDEARYRNDGDYKAQIDMFRKIKSGRGTFPANHFVNVSNAVCDDAGNLTHLIVSDTGSGKTTMVPRDLLQRAYDGLDSYRVSQQGCVVTNGKKA